MTAAMRQVATVLEVPSDDAQLLQLTNNAVFALPRSGIVIRIARTHRLRDRVTKVVQLARWLAEVDAPTIRLAPGIEQPVEVGDLVASVWTYLPPQTPPPVVAELGVVLREFHVLGVPPTPLPVWNPIQDARRRLDDAEGIDRDDREFLMEWCDRLDQQVAALNECIEPKLIHGDAHAGNLLRDSSGKVVLCDFDATCVGPWQVDLAAAAVGEARFGDTGAHGALAAAYGFDVTSDPSWPFLREVRELKMIVAATPILLTSTEIAAEFAIRLSSVRDDNREARWVPFAALATPTGSCSSSTKRSRHFN